MHKQQAIQEMMLGKKVTHRYFSPDEYITMDKGLIYTEEGYSTTADLFWEDRQGKEWENDWSLFDKDLPSTNKQPTDREKSLEWWRNLAPIVRKRLSNKWGIIDITECAEIVWRKETQPHPTDMDKMIEWWNNLSFTERDSLITSMKYHAYDFSDHDDLIEVWRKETQPLPSEDKGEELMDRQVVEAYCHIRKTNNSIPDDVLDFMKDAAIAHTDLYNALKELLEVDYTSGTHLYCAQIKARKAILKANHKYICPVRLPE